MKMRPLPLIGTLTWLSLSACSTVPPAPSPPVVLQCPKPKVDPPLLQPAQRAAMSRLLAFLQTLPPSVSATPTGSTPSSPK